MKFIIGQNRERAFGVAGMHVLVDIVPINVDEEGSIKIYSVGVRGVSMGTYKSKAKAKEILSGLISFMAKSDEKIKFEMPLDAD